VEELADSPALGAGAREGVGVRIPPLAQRSHKSRQLWVQDQSTVSRSGGEGSEHHPGDLRVIAQMKQLGWDLNEPRLVEHFLYFPTESSARDVAATLGSRGYEVTVRPGADGVNWLVRPNVRMVITPDSITSQRMELTQLASAQGGEYDGWGAPE
jgi:hypothetical protein